MDANKPIVAVSALVVKQDQILLVQRKKPPNQGLWVLPGGKIEAGETQVQAVEREVQEESGISVKALKPVAVNELIHADGQALSYHYIIISYLAQYQEGELRCASDALSAAWVHANQLDSMAIENTCRSLIDAYFAQQLPALTTSPSSLI